MSKRCIICDKGTKHGKNVSKSNRKTLRTFKANLQKIRIVLDGINVRSYVCTHCLKANKVQKAI